MTPRRRDLWRQDVLSRRHILQRRPPGSISAKSHKKGKMWNYFAKRAKLQKIRPAARQPGGLGGRPPRCRAASPQGPICNFLSSFFSDKPLPPGSQAARSRPPGSGAAGYISVNFQIENIFLLKIEIKNKKNKKPRRIGQLISGPEGVLQNWAVGRPYRSTTSRH